MLSDEDDRHHNAPPMFRLWKLPNSVAIFDSEIAIFFSKIIDSCVLSTVGFLYYNDLRCTPQKFSLAPDLCSGLSVCAFIPFMTFPATLIRNVCDRNWQMTRDDPFHPRLAPWTKPTYVYLVLQGQGSMTLAIIIESEWWLCYHLTILRIKSLYTPRSVVGPSLGKTKTSELGGSTLQFGGRFL
jgi:hypothetical protein